MASMTASDAFSVWAAASLLMNPWYSASVAGQALWRRRASRRAMDERLAGFGAGFLVVGSWKRGNWMPPSSRACRKFLLYGLRRPGEHLHLELDDFDFDFDFDFDLETPEEDVQLVHLVPFLVGVDGTIRTTAGAADCFIVTVGSGW
jgi:hypothetical protein